MAKTLQIPNEPRFVRAFALSVDPGDTLSLLLEVGALSSLDLTIVRRTREALDPAYDRASDVKDWEQTHTPPLSCAKPWPSRILQPTWPLWYRAITRPATLQKPWPSSAAPRIL